MSIQKILVIGNNPPPLGGVSVYVRRRFQQLKSSGSAVELFPSRPSVLQLIKIIPNWVMQRFDVIEINSIRWIWPVLLRLIFLRAQIVMIDHNNSHRFKNFSVINRILYGMAFQALDKIDLVRESLTDNYDVLWFHNALTFGTRSPYLKPSVAEQNEAINTWHTDLKQFVHEQPELIVSCASILDLKNDVYHFMDCLEAFSMVQKNHPNSRLLLIASTCEDAYFQKMQMLITEFGLINSVFFKVGHFEIWPLFKFARILLRITSTDGDSVTVREALDEKKCHVIATNVVKRPEGVNLVNLNQTAELADSINRLLDK